MAPVDLLRFTGTEFEPLAIEIERASHLHRLACEVNAALSHGDADRARSAIGILRTMLQTYSGTLSAEAYRRAGECKLLIDACQNRHHAALQDGSLMVRSKLKPIETWAEFFPLLNVANTMSALKTWPEVAPDLQRLRGFVDSGNAALASDLAALKLGKNPTLTVMLWLAAYLVRTSEHHLARSDGAAGLALSVCALESYVNFRLFELNVLAYDPLRKELYPTSTGRNLFAKYSLGDGVKGSLMVLADSAVLGTMATGDVEEVIRLRNQCILTHGVQRLSLNDATEALRRVKALIKAAEAKTSAVGARWNNLLVDSFVIDWTKVGPKTFAPLLS
ncbi:hypothetical protein [Rubrivivax gelatinosus]|nr:hypothetical protein [Rubrivivax gelatinosus]